MADRRAVHSQQGFDGSGRQSALLRRGGSLCEPAASGRPCIELRGPTFMSTQVRVGLAAAIAIGGCGATSTTTATTATTAAATSRPSAPAWERGTPRPEVTPALIRQAGHRLTAANVDLGTVDEVFWAVAANVHVSPAATALNDQYARFGRCMGEYLKTHNLGHELALLVAYDRKDRRAQPAVETPQFAQAWLQRPTPVTSNP
jgi:hypothetical protein